MKLPDLDPSKPLHKDTARRELIHLLQNAHAGERAAANAYYGHERSPFVRNPVEKKEIRRIYDDELHHRSRLNEMLTELNAGPRRLREWLMFSIGATIAFLCLFGGWFVPMYGAGKLERSNIAEYEIAARLALLAGLPHLVEELLVFAEVEWDHEQYFRRKSAGHPFIRLFRMWEEPPPEDR